MNSLRALFLALCLFLSSRESNAVVGGALVSSESKFFKFSVLLKHYNSEDFARCSGSLIADDIILTAAHCLPKSGVDEIVLTATPDSKKKVGKVRIGVVFEKTDGSPGLELHAVSYAKHPAYNEDYKPKFADIALIRFAGKRPEGTRPARIYPKEITNRMMGEKTATAIGFGLEEYWHEDVEITEPRMKSVDLRVLGVATSIHALQLDLTSTNGVTKGDSGGSLLIEEDGESAVIGVAAYVSPKYNPTTAAYTLVAPYLEWIRTTAAKMREKPAQ